MSQLRNTFEKNPLRFYPDLGDDVFHRPELFAVVQELEANWAVIRQEFAAVPPEALHREGEKIAREGKWDVFMLYELGRRVDENCDRVPTTAAIIDKHRTLKGFGGLAYFSRLGPRSAVAPHSGPTNLRVRCHLGLTVPDHCGIVVDDLSSSWSEGRCIVFDDSFEHSVWNDSDRERIVLIVDLWHPNLTEDEITLLDALHRHIEFASGKREKYWRVNDDLRLERKLAAIV